MYDTHSLSYSPTVSNSNILDWDLFQCREGDKERAPVWNSRIMDSHTNCELCSFRHLLHIKYDMSSTASNSGHVNHMSSQQQYRFQCTRDTYIWEHVIMHAAFVVTMNLHRGALSIGRVFSKMCGMIARILLGKKLAIRSLCAARYYYSILCKCIHSLEVNCKIR